MNKFNNKGFFLSETLIVATVVTAVVTLLYVGIINILNNYNKRMYYNTVTSLYVSDSIRSIIYDKGVSYFIDKLGDQKYYSITCSDFSDLVNQGEEELCNFIYNFGLQDNNIGSIVVDKVIFTEYDVTELKNFSDTNAIIEGTTTDYIKTLPVVAGTSDYRIIVVLMERGVIMDTRKAKRWYSTLKVVGE